MVKNKKAPAAEPSTGSAAGAFLRHFIRLNRVRRNGAVDVFFLIV
jgi:hypothetical protein